MESEEGYGVKIDSSGHYSTGFADQIYPGILYPTNFYQETYRHTESKVIKINQYKAFHRHKSRIKKMPFTF